MSLKSIAILHYSCPPVVGGVEEIVRQHALLFHRYNHRVKIIAGTGSYFTNDFEIRINPLLASRSPEILKSQNDHLQNLVSIKKSTESILEYLQTCLIDIDVLIAHNVLSMHYNLPLTLALHHLTAQKEKDIKIVGWNHDSPYFYKNYSKELDKDFWSILKCYNPNISYITISNRRAKEFKALYNIKEELTVIPNGIDPICIFRLDPITVRLIQENNLFSFDLLLVQPSKFHPRKNIELSIRVLKCLNDLGQKAMLLLTGAYDSHERKTLYYYNKIKKLAESLQVSKNIIIVAQYIFNNGEKLSADQIIMRDLFQIADFLFMPSKQEGFGIPLIEAGIIKLPIVCSDIPTFKSIVNENVLYFSLKDEPEKIAKKVLNFLDNLKPHRMYRTVIKNYIWDNIYHRSLKPFLEMV